MSGNDERYDDWYKQELEKETFCGICGGSCEVLNVKRKKRGDKVLYERAYRCLECDFKGHKVKIYESRTVK